MIGFQAPGELYEKTGEPKDKPGTEKREVPTIAPGREITNPNPATIPNPEPDIIHNSPTPEIPSIPLENPVPNTGPEIMPAMPSESNGITM